MKLIYENPTPAYKAGKGVNKISGREQNLEPPPSRLPIQIQPSLMVPES